MNFGNRARGFAQGMFQVDPGASPEAAARKREILTAMLAGQRRPQSVGEGVMDGVSRAIAGWQMGKLDRAEGAKRDEASAAFKGILGGVPAPQGPLTITGVDPSWGQSAALLEPAGYGITPGAANGAAAPELRQPFASGAYGLPDSLVKSESGGKWSALNSEGYGGRGQFGADRLADAARAGVIPAGMTGADYAKAPPEVQLAVENWHRDDVLKDLGQYVGVDPDGPGPIPPMTPDSLLAVAHLGGKGGAKRFVESGGRYNPADSNGTHLSDYATRHASGVAGQPFNVPAYSGPPIADLQAAVMNPWLSQEERQMAASMLDRAMQQGDPAYQMQMAQGQLGLQKTQMEIAQMGQPAPVEYGWQMAPDGTLIRTDSTGGIAPMGQYAKPDTPEAPASVREYEYYVQQAQARGDQPMPYEQFSVEKARAGASNVSVENNMGQDKFAEAFATGDAKALGTISEAGIAAQRNIGRIDQLEAMLQSTPTGAVASWKQWAGERGISTEGLDDIQAAQALINSLVPEQRQPGSGPMSDADLALFKQSLPRIINQPGGNEAIIGTMRAIAEYDAQGAEIVQQLRAGQIDRAQAFQMLQSRPNPLEAFKAPPQAAKTSQPTVIDGYTIEAVD